MIKRLKSDHFVKKLLIADDGDGDNSKSASKEKRGAHTNNNSETTQVTRGLPLCEALIQQNKSSSTSGISATQTTNGGYELEERVNVHEESLEAIRKAILSHAEGNLDVLELLLSMPYLPRPGFAGDGCTDNSDQSTYTKALYSMAERAYLRLLEDAMFDACEKEGEDELLDDLNISDTKNDDSTEEEQANDGKREKKPQPKKTKQCA